MAPACCPEGGAVLPPRPRTSSTRHPRVTPSGVSEHFLKLLGSRQSPCPVPLPTSLSNQGPFPPPALPGFLSTMGLSATPPTGLPVLRSSPSSMRAAATTKRARVASGIPAESVGARGARFPSDGSLPRHSGGSASALSVSRPARRSHLLRPAWSLSRPWRPVSSECFKRCRYLHHPLRLPPAGATVAGRDSHPLREGAFARRTKGIQLQTLREELIHFLIERLQERLDRAAQSVSKLSGEPVTFRNDKGERVRDRLQAFDFGPVAQSAGLPPNCRRKEFAAEDHRNSVSTPV